MATERQGIQVEGLKPLLKTLSRLGKETNARIRTAAKAIAADEAPRLQSAAQSSSKQSKAVGVTVRARSDRVPAIAAGGAKRVNVSGLKGKSRPSAGAIFFGAEFGGQKRKTTMQFRPHRGRKGYWFWPQLRADQDQMMRRWADAVDGILEDQALSDRMNPQG